jgi:hypothetical protein
MLVSSIRLSMGMLGSLTGIEVVRQSQPNGKAVAKPRTDGKGTATRVSMGAQAWDSSFGETADAHVVDTSPPSSGILSPRIQGSVT